MPIYLDHNATTPLRLEVFDAITPFLRDEFGNASSTHAFGSRARCAIEDARGEVGEVLQASPSEIVFTSGGTESNNMAITGAARAAVHRRVLVGAIEHSSVVAAAASLEREGFTIESIPTDACGVTRLADLKQMLENGPALVSVGWANNEIGTLQPIDEIAKICAQHGSPLHVDAVQAFGKVPVKTTGVDLLSLSAHKIGGPKGVGVLFVRQGVELVPTLFGGGQERGRRAGTENVAAIVGMGLACKLAHTELDWFSGTAAALRDRLWTRLREQVGDVHRHGADHGLPNTLNVRFDGVRGEALVAALDLAGIAVSSGSACAAGAGEPSHVLCAIGLDDSTARDGVRYSVGRTNTPDEIDYVAVVTAAAVERIRAAHRQTAA
jgi:cysteine desulfurase